MRSSLEAIAKKHDKTIRALVEEKLTSEGSIRAAARSLGISYTSLYLWLARNGYAVKISAHLVPATHITEPEMIHE